MFPLSNDDEEDDDDGDDDEEEEDVSTFQCPFHRIPLNSGLWEKDGEEAERSRID